MALLPAPAQGCVNTNVSKEGRTRHPWGQHPILLPCQRGNRRKALCPLPLNQPLLSTLPALSSSWPFPIVCLSGDNGRLSVMRSLTQFRSVRRRTSGEWGDGDISALHPRDPSSPIRTARLADEVQREGANPRAQCSLRLQPVLLQGKSKRKGH